jgi:histidinol dehydrogenase
MKIFEIGHDQQTDIDAAIAPLELEYDEELSRTVRDIISDVRKRGNVALLEYGQKFDSPDMETIMVTDHDFDEAYSSVSKDLLHAIETARTNIWAYHRHQLRSSWTDMREGRIYGQQIHQNSLISRNAFRRVRFF